jgi:hypothetical protein
MRSGNPTAADLIEQPSRWSLPRHEFFVARASYFQCKGFPLERPQRLLNDNLMVSTERKPTSAFKHPGVHSSQNINSAGDVQWISILRAVSIPRESQFLTANSRAK